ncbi:MAG: hypothetical protein AAGG56_09230 [Pseudomonadota bacterium]
MNEVLDFQPLEQSSALFTVPERLRAALEQEASHTSVIEAPLGDSAFPQSLSIERLVFPNDEKETPPPRQDFPNNQGLPWHTAAWMPLSDCPVEITSIAILEGSHRLGPAPLTGSRDHVNRWAVLPNMIDELTWTSTDFQFSDSMFFKVMTVQTSLPNWYSQKLCLSIEFQYQPTDERWSEDFLELHLQIVFWHKTNIHSEDDNLKYHWRGYACNFAAFDTHLHYLSKYEELTFIREWMGYECRYWNGSSRVLQ